jgi:hypothetical protein
MELIKPEQIDDLEQRLAERASALNARYTRTTQALADAEQRHKEQLARQLDGVTDGAEADLIRKVQGRAHSRELGRLRRQLLEEAEGDVAGIMAPVDDIEASVAATEKLWASPVAVLSRAALGDAKKSEYLRQLDGAGPAELMAAGELALLEKNRALQSAVLLTADRGGEKYKRHFDKVAFASKAVGPEVEAMQQRLQELRLKVEAMKAVRKTFESTGKAEMSSQQKIELGIARRRLAS